MTLSLQDHAALSIYWKLRDDPKKCPEGLRAIVVRLNEYYKNPSAWSNDKENSYTIVCELVKILPDYADELQAICAEKPTYAFWKKFS